MNEIIKSPERSLSDLGLRIFLSYWKYNIACEMINIWIRIITRRATTIVRIIIMIMIIIIVIAFIDDNNINKSDKNKDKNFDNNLELILKIMSDRNNNNNCDDLTTQNISRRLFIHEEDIVNILIDIGVLKINNSNNNNNNNNDTNISDNDNNEYISSPP
jgi:hypothetical protein